MNAMGARTNNEVFKEATARILSHLWEHSPVPTALTSSTVPQLFPELTAEESKVFRVIITWLEDEQFIRTRMVETQFPG